MYTDSLVERLLLPADLKAVLQACRCLVFPESLEELRELAYGPARSSRYEVCYPIPGRGLVTEAEVLRCKNGALVNFPEDYMRRRDPDCMRIGDDLPSDKPRFEALYGYPFSRLRGETMDWLAGQQLILLPFKAGGPCFGYDSLMVCPMNAAFFALSLAEMAGFVSLCGGEERYRPRGIIYVAPPFRHTHFAGKQVVVHQRSETLHEVFSYNLYPGPSAKKGVFSILLDIGEREGWITNHASAALLESPGAGKVVFLHEGASGGGKSEMLAQIPFEADGGLLLGEHPGTGEKLRLRLRETCLIHPIADDMVLCRGSFQNGSGRLVIADAEDGWFLRTDDDTCYGRNTALERISIHPSEPLVFFNLDGVPGATCLIWEHIADSDGRPCSNPRVIVPRRMFDRIVPGDRPQEVTVRSFGVRMPPSTRSAPDCGVMGMLQVVPVSIAWLWRLVSPRGFRNPSIADADSGLRAEGVGSYWPFCTGRRVTQANLLLRQMLACPKTLNILIPNQHIGACRVGFMGEWLTREYLARQGGCVRLRQLVPARCPLFGYSLEEMTLDGQHIPRGLLRPELQSRLGLEGYDAGAEILSGFFKDQFAQFDCGELDPLGREIIRLAMRGAPLEDYLALTPMALC